MYNHSYHHHHPHSQQRQQHKLPSLHHLMLPSPPPSYHSKLLPQPQSSHSYPMNATSNHCSLMPPRAPRMEPYEYFTPLKSTPSDNQVLNDASLLLFGTCHNSTIPYQSTLASTLSSLSSSAAPFQDFVLFESLDQRHTSSSSSLSPPCKGKLIPDLNASSHY